MIKKIQVHIISHTHWDREWFLTKDYTNKWLVPFFERLFSLLREDKEYKFVLDGQVLMVNDYLEQLSRDEREKKLALLRKYGKEKRLFFWSILGSNRLANCWTGIDSPQYFTWLQICRKIRQFYESWLVARLLWANRTGSSNS